ncbi:MAG: hypothetical protein BWY73_00220 [candidate division TA06 bacterium ADurb.Bin417]|uniref:Uncharacterized protein n=1 Tax=candidate division TA06 bacterium ADurb.Bin417 TaxID=1852828 RepID=A0A1V5MK87_UNCT6|nr:MAG: hypothetical protein BWY73_00220 [candidate division TA06 bacterium ADurb.Bin417]
MAAIAGMLILGVGPVRAESPVRVLFDFESGLQGWRPVAGLPAAGELIRLDSGLDGSACLQFGLNLPGEAGVAVKIGENWQPYQSLLFDLSVSDSAPADLECLVYLKDKEWLWYQSRPRRLEPGTRVVIGLGLSGVSLAWNPEGHKRPWNFYSTELINELGLKFLARQPGRAWIRLDNVRLDPGLFISFKFDRFRNETPEKVRAASYPGFLSGPRF